MMRNDEWISFLATVFPRDVIAQNKITVIRLATKLKNQRNLKYRGRQKVKTKQATTKQNDKVIRSKVLPTQIHSNY